MATTSHFEDLTPGMKARIDPASRLPKRVGLLQSNHTVRTIMRRKLLSKLTGTTDTKSYPGINRIYRY